MKTRTAMAVLTASFLLLCFVRWAELLSSVDNRVYAMAMDLSYSGPWLYFWEIVSSWGEGKAVYSLTGIMALFWLWRRRSPRTAGVILLMTAAFLSNTALKFAFKLERPVSLSPYTELTTYSFPSGHAFNAVVLFWFLPRFAGLSLGKPAAREILSPWFWGTGLGIVGVSRVLLGAHWGSDVIGGWLLGGIVCLSLIRLLETRARCGTA